MTVEATSSVSAVGEKTTRPPDDSLVIVALPPSLMRPTRRKGTETVVIASVTCLMTVVLDGSALQSLDDMMISILIAVLDDKVGWFIEVIFVISECLE